MKTFVFVGLLCGWVVDLSAAGPKLIPGQLDVIKTDLRARLDYRAKELAGLKEANVISPDIVENEISKNAELRSLLLSGEMITSLEAFRLNPLAKGLHVYPSPAQVIDPDADPTAIEAVPGARAGLRETPPAMVSWTDAKFLDFVGGISEKNDPLNSVFGSAVYIGKGRFATAWHVLSRAVKLGSGYVRSARVKSGSMVSDDVFSIILSTIVKDEARDIAIFSVLPAPNGKFPGEVFKTAEVGNPASFPILTKVSITGFPYGSITAMETQDNRLVKVIPSWTEEAKKAAADVFALGTSFAGNSGSGLFEPMSGKLLGIVRAQGSNAGDFNPDGTNVTLAPTMGNAFRAVSVVHVAALLKD